MTRSPKCPLCPKPVSTIRNPLICSNCKLAFHKKCCPLSHYEISKLAKRNLGWTCEVCMNSLFPFTSIENNEFNTIFTDTVSSVSTNVNTKNKCGNCSKLIYKNFPFFACKTCFKNYHIKCSIDRKETYLNSPNWECDHCVIQQLPFSCINNNELSAIKQGPRSFSISGVFYHVGL